MRLSNLLFLPLFIMLGCGSGKELGSLSSQVTETTNQDIANGNANKAIAVGEHPEQRANKLNPVLGGSESQQFRGPLEHPPSSMPEVGGPARIKISVANKKFYLDHSIKGLGDAYRFNSESVLYYEYARARGIIWGATIIDQNGNPILKTWRDALNACKEIGGELPTKYDFDTLAKQLGKDSAAAGYSIYTKDGKSELLTGSKSVSDFWTSTTSSIYDTGGGLALPYTFKGLTGESNWTASNNKLAVRCIVRSDGCETSQSSEPLEGEWQACIPIDSNSPKYFPDDIHHGAVKIDFTIKKTNGQYLIGYSGRRYQGRLFQGSNCTGEVKGEFIPYRNVSYYGIPLSTENGSANYHVNEATGDELVNPTDPKWRKFEPFPDPDHNYDSISNPIMLTDTSRVDDRLLIKLRIAWEFGLKQKDHMGSIGPFWYSEIATGDAYRLPMCDELAQ